MQLKFHPWAPEAHLRSWGGDSKNRRNRSSPCRPSAVASAPPGAPQARRTETAQPSESPDRCPPKTISGGWKRDSPSATRTTGASRVQLLRTLRRPDRRSRSGHADASALAPSEGEILWHRRPPNRIKALDARLRGGTCRRNPGTSPERWNRVAARGVAPASQHKWLASFGRFHAMGSVNPVWFSTCKFSIGEVIADGTDHDG